MTNYADAGVDIDAGNRAVKLTEAVRSTNWPQRFFPNSAPSEVCSLPTDLAKVRFWFVDRRGRPSNSQPAMAAGTASGATQNHCVDDILVQGRPLLLDYIAAKPVPETVAAIVTGKAKRSRRRLCVARRGDGRNAGVYTDGAVDIAGTIVGAAS